MAADLSDCSVAEIRERYLKKSSRVSRYLLGRLRNDQRQGVQDLYLRALRRYRRQQREERRTKWLLRRERELWEAGMTHVAGVDEAGMGPLAGPIVAAAVIFEPGAFIVGLDDSKRLQPVKRQWLAKEIRSRALSVGLGLAEVEEVDLLNVYQAGLLAMGRAIAQLRPQPEHLLIDARRLPEIQLPQEAIINGDRLHFSIAAASIIAKTHRDALMKELDRDFPNYGFANHKGYGTQQHQDSIRRFGRCALHRASYQFVQELAGDCSPLFYRLKGQLGRIDRWPDVSRFQQALTRQAVLLRSSEARRLRSLLLQKRRQLERSC